MVKEKAVVSTAQPKKLRKAAGAPMSAGTGRRKEAVARVWQRRGTGVIVVNGQDYKKYFDTDTMRLAVAKPLTLFQKNYDFQVNVCGGGKMGQAGAVQLGISRALLKSDEKFRILLRQHSLLTVDSRIKERKKYGQKGARAKFQFVKR